MRRYESRARPERAVSVNSPASSRVEGWPQFRGPGSTGVTEGANLPDTWSSHAERHVEDDDSRQRLVVADRMGRSDLRHVGHSGRRHRNAEARPLSPGRAPGADDRSSLHGLRDRLRDRKDRLGARSASRLSSRRPASQEHVRVGNTGHRRHARLRGIRQRRHLRLRFQRQADLDIRDRSVADTQRLGHGRITGASRRPSLFRQRQRDGARS